MRSQKSGLTVAFEFPGSTHAIRVRVGGLDARARVERETAVMNTNETAASGCRSLKFVAKPVEPGENVYVYKKTYYQPKDFVTVAMIRASHH